jgi:lipopolysaccharide export system permease protein
MAGFLGALTGLGRLQQDSEITAMRAVGWSIAKIGAVCALAGFALSGVALLIGEFVAPQLAQSAVERRTGQLYGPEMSASGSGWWTRDATHIIGLDPGRGERSVIVVSLDDDGDLVAYADARELRRQGANGSVVYGDYRETQFSEQGTRIVKDSERAAPGVETSALLALSQDSMWAPSIQQLTARIRQYGRAGLEHNAFVYELHERITRIVTAPLLVLLAVVSVIGPMRSSKQGSRLVFGVVVGFALSICRDAAQSLVVVAGAMPTAMAWIPTLLTAIALLLMGRYHHHPRPARRFAELHRNPV